MKVLVAGATGGTGRHVVRELKARGHEPVAMIREGSDISGLPEGIETRQADLTDLQPGGLDGCEAVVFAAGSGSKTGSEMTDKVDRDGAKRLVDLAKSAGVSRFVMLSSFGAQSPAPDHPLGHYLEAKHDADAHLRASGLDHAILRPVGLSDDEGRRDVILGDGVSAEGKASRADVAALLAQAVDDPDWSGRVADMQSA